MIPRAHLQAWRSHIPWPDLRQVEQDLIICRALCDIFTSPALMGKIAFRGGTAIHKLLFREPLRYSEDIDLVQIQAEPSGKTIDAIRDALSWLGKCKRTQAAHSTHLTFQFEPESNPDAKLKLKVEFNTREHESLLGLKEYPFQIENPWFTGKANIVSYEPEELFGTKLRALLQRHKNRDLFDMQEGLGQLDLDLDKTVMVFEHYLALQNSPISRAEAEMIMLDKLTRSLTDDIAPLLPSGVVYGHTESIAAFNMVWNLLISRVPGAPWKNSDQVIADFRATRYPELLS